MKQLMAVFALAAAAFAQGPADRPAPTYDDLKTYLTLTDAQLTTLKTAHTAALENAKTYFDQIREKQQSLRNLTDAAAIAKVMAEINELQAKVKAIMDAARTAAVGTLSTAQQAKLKTLQDAMALNDEIRQAGSLGLLSPPEGSTGGPGGPGPRGFGGMRR
jgi:replicative DNA helicase